MNNGPKAYAPETAVGTGAAEPLVDEYEAAKETPSVDESTIGEGGSNNQPGHETIAYSKEDPQTTPSLDDGGATLGVESTGEDFETRNREDDTAAGSSVSDADVDGSDVNKKAEETRPEVPQATKRSRSKAS